MDGLFHGNPYEQMGWFGGKTHYFWRATHIAAVTGETPTKLGLQLAPWPRSNWSLMSDLPRVKGGYLRLPRYTNIQKMVKMLGNLIY